MGTDQGQVTEWVLPWPMLHTWPMLHSSSKFLFILLQQIYNQKQIENIMSLVEITQAILPEKSVLVLLTCWLQETGHGLFTPLCCSSLLPSFTLWS